MTGRSVRGVAAVVLAAAAVAGGFAAPPATADDSPPPVCPALFTVGVQAPGQAAADTPATIDSGLLGEVLRPLVTRPASEFERLYVRVRPAAHGVRTGDGTSPFEAAVTEAGTVLSQTVADFARRCPQGRVAVVADSHGAVAASRFAQQVGAGRGPIPAEAVAAVALFADLARTSAASLFPGATAKTVPDPVPGTSGDAVTAIAALPQQPLTGSGIDTATRTTNPAGTTTAAAGYGALTGRVASFCVAGDLACDAADRAPIATVVANLTAAAGDTGGDPLRALASVGQALAFTAIKTATTIVNDDLGGTSLSSLSLPSGTSLSQRLVQASDPRTPLDLNAAFKAVLKVGTIAVNSILTVAKTVLTPANLAEIAAAGLANPAAGLAALGTKLVGALPQLIPPATAARLVGQAFDTVVTTITDNTALIDTTTWVRYSDSLSRTGAYTSTPLSAAGRSPAAFTTDWLRAILDDLADPATTATTATALPTNSRPPAPATPAPATPAPATPAPTSSGSTSSGSTSSR